MTRFQLVYVEAWRLLTQLLEIVALEAHLWLLLLLLAEVFYLVFFCGADA